METQTPLYDRLCDERTLYEAWKSVRSKKSAGGIDGVTLARFDEALESNISGLSDELRRGTWSSEPYKTLEIPKKGKDKRRLGLLAVKDKIVQSAIKSLTEPYFENVFVDNSYGYRPGKGHAKAVRRALSECMRKDNRYVLRLDIDNYFDTINHDLLAARLKEFIPDAEIVRLMMLSVRMGFVNKCLKWTDREAGVPQGAVLSPLLSNFYLHPFDKYVLTLSRSYVRYADDFCIMCSTETQAHDILRSITGYLDKHLGLKLNTPVVRELWRGFDFLGLTISKDGLSMSAKKDAELRKRIGAMALTSKGLSAGSVKAWEGIRAYYGTLLPQDMLTQFDDLLYERVKRAIADGYKSIANRAALKRLVADIPYLSNDYQLHSQRVTADYMDVYDRLKAAGGDNAAEEQNKRVIERRKAEYRKREGAGSELVVNMFGCFLGLSKQCVTVKREGKTIARKPAFGLTHIMVCGGGVSLSTNLIDYCMANKISVDFFNSSGAHTGSILSNKYIEGTLWNKQAQCGADKRIALASAIIDAKVRNQFNLIKYFHKYHKMGHSSLASCYEDMADFYRQFRSFIRRTSKDSAGYLASMVRMEAQGAVKYWAYIRVLLSDDGVDFERRVRRGATDLVNCMLNYGYAILYSRVWQALLAAKLNPYDSIVHARQPGKPAFVYDVVEMFRAQVVDRVVFTLIQKGTPLAISRGILDSDTRKQLSRGVLERLNRYEKYRGEEITMERIIRQQAREIADWIDLDEHYKPYIAKW